MGLLFSLSVLNVFLALVVSGFTSHGAIKVCRPDIVTRGGPSGGSAVDVTVVSRS